MSDLPAPLGFPTPKPIDPAVAGDQVDKLFGAWGTAGEPFKPYIIFNAMATDVDALKIVAGDAENAQGQPVNFWPFPGSPNGMRFQYISALVASGDSSAVFSPNPSNAVFVLTEMFSAPLTYAATQIVSNAMMAGLCTRLILSSYNAKWGSNINLDLGLAGGFGLQTAIAKLSTDLMNPKSWTQKATFEVIHRSLTDSASTQAAGIVLGWVAADSIFQITDVQKQTDCITSIWKLIGSKYTTRDLGAIVSFTLNYLIGFIRNSRTKDIANGLKIPAQRDIGIILQQLTDQVLRDPGDDKLVALTQNFHRMLADEFYAIARKDVSSTFSAAARQTALEQYRAFLVGFQRGTMVAAELLFKETFSSAFDIGYAMGFRDGYAQGYAAGWQAGYDTGYTEGKAVGFGLTNTLTQVSDTLTKIDGFVNDLSKAGTTIVEIGNLF